MKFSELQVGDKFGSFDWFRVDKTIKRGNITVFIDIVFTEEDYKTRKRIRIDSFHPIWNKDIK